MSSDAVSTATVGRNVEKAREAAGLSRDDLAMLTGLATSTVFRIEKGTVAPGAHTLGRIADELGVTVDSLLRDAS